MSRRPQNPSGSPRNPDHREDLELARAVVGGSLTAWHELIDRFSSLIHGVLRRQLFGEDEDDIESVYADVLEALDDGGLAGYEGRSKLSTWLIVFSRNRALDLLRKRYGRARPPRWLDRLDPLRRELVRLHFVERLPFEIVVHQARLAGHDATPSRVLEALLELSDVVPDEYLRRAAAGPLRHEDLDACSPALMQRLRSLSENAGGPEASPDGGLLAAEEEERLGRLRAAMKGLSPREARVLHLRFYEGWAAPRIARELGLDGPRKVYTITERVLAKLRSALELEDPRS